MKTNHQRGFVEKVTNYVGPHRNGDAFTGYKEFDTISLLADKSIGASANIHHGTDGKHGVARNIRGAKKFVRSRVRFHENAITRAMMMEEVIAGE